jgi:hypothetical protein
MLFICLPVFFRRDNCFSPERSLSGLYSTVVKQMFDNCRIKIFYRHSFFFVPMQGRRDAYRGEEVPDTIYMPLIRLYYKVNMYLCTLHP